MCMGGTPKAPAPAPKAPEAPVAPDINKSTGVDSDRRRRAAAGTILTGSRGLSDTPTTANKTLLGA